MISSGSEESPNQLLLQRCDRCRARSTCGLPMSGKYEGCCSLVVLPSVPPRTSRCGSNCISEKARARIPAASSSFCNFFAAPYSSRRLRVFPGLAVGWGSPWVLHVAVFWQIQRRPAPDGPLPWPRTRDDVRGATQKSAFSRSARRLASSGAAPVRLDGS